MYQQCLRVMVLLVLGNLALGGWASLAFEVEKIKPPNDLRKFKPEDVIKQGEKVVPGKKNEFKLPPGPGKGSFVAACKTGEQMTITETRCEKKIHDDHTWTTECCTYDIKYSCGLNASGQLTWFEIAALNKRDCQSRTDDDVGEDFPQTEAPPN